MVFKVYNFCRLQPFSSSSINFLFSVIFEQDCHTFVGSPVTGIIFLSAAGKANKHLNRFSSILDASTFKLYLIHESLYNFMCLIVLNKSFYKNDLFLLFFNILFY